MPPEAEIQQDQVSSSTPSESTPPPAAAPEPAPASTTPGSEASPPPAAEPGVTPPAGAEGEPGADGVVPPKPFAPREKFKAWREEHEVPKWMRDLVKDPDTETKAIQLLEKATGLDIMKPKFEETKTELATVRGQHSAIQGQIQDLRSTFQRGDIDLWLQKLSIPAERMLQWALDKVQYSQLPPDQQRILDERTEAQRRAYQLEQQQGYYQQQALETQRQTKATVLESGLTRPDVQTFVDAFDAKAGQPGAFRKEVIAHGQTTYALSNGQTDLTPEQAIEAVMSKYKTFFPAPSAQAQPGQAPGNPAQRVVLPAQGAPTIPNVQGKSTSPLKSQPRSIDDLRKLHRASQGN